MSDQSPIDRIIEFRALGFRFRCWEDADPADTITTIEKRTLEVLQAVRSGKASHYNSIVDMARGIGELFGFNAVQVHSVRNISESECSVGVVWYRSWP